MTPAGLALTALVSVAMSLGALAHDAPHKLTGPADRYVYELAAPGTYRLPVIKPAGGGIVLDETGARYELKDLLAGRLTILAFVYTRCGDVCPLATMRLGELRELAGRAGLGSLRLITMSFDPDFDTPEKMAAYAAPWRDGADAVRVPWLFLTAPSRTAIAPMLKAYNQPVAPRADTGDALGPISHLMRVFLIDTMARIRNIYSPDFLDPRLLLNDVLTLDAAAQG
jgi:cytochrome oxidase Cu insertion factor (SCO1/SenC/PrrC family)